MAQHPQDIVHSNDNHYNDNDNVDTSAVVGASNNRNDISVGWQLCFVLPPSRLPHAAIAKTVTSNS